MDLSRTVYSRDLKIAAMRALDAGATAGEVVRKYQVSPISWIPGAGNGAPRETWHSQESAVGEFPCGPSMTAVVSPS
jgi:hypothetical protein